MFFLRDKEHEYFCLPFLDCGNRETFGFETTVGDIKKYNDTYIIWLEIKEHNVAYDDNDFPFGFDKEEETIAFFEISLVDASNDEKIMDLFVNQYFNLPIPERRVRFTPGGFIHLYPSSAELIKYSECQDLLFRYLSLKEQSDKKYKKIRK